jgi:shikimate kinase
MSRAPIILTGFLGSGKSTVAEALGRALNRIVIDLDDVITSNTGRTPGEIIEEDGEKALRELETQFLKQVLNGNTAQVVALGGGAWIQEQNRDLITQCGGVSVWLDAPFELCWKRIATMANTRPLAKNRPRAKALFEQRRSDYALAQVRVAITEDQPVDTIVDEIITTLDLTLGD